MYSDETTFGNKNALLLTARVSFASRFTYTTIRREADTPMKPHERDVIKHWHLKMLDDESKHTRQKEVKDVLSCRDVDVALDNIDRYRKYKGSLHGRTSRNAQRSLGRTIDYLSSHVREDGIRYEAWCSK